MLQARGFVGSTTRLTILPAPGKKSYPSLNKQLFCSEAPMPHFPDVAPIKYEGPESKNPLAFRHYNASEVVEGKSMKDHLRFAVCYWHTFRGTGADPFGPGCAIRPWEDGTDSLEMALKRVDVAFEFMDKLGVPVYCFH